MRKDPEDVPMGIGKEVAMKGVVERHKALAIFLKRKETSGDILSSLGSHAVRSPRENGDS